jgi:hypothetical protein
VQRERCGKVVGQIQAITDLIAPIKENANQLKKMLDNYQNERITTKGIPRPGATQSLNGVEFSMAVPTKQG